MHQPPQRQFLVPRPPRWAWSCLLLAVPLLVACGRKDVPRKVDPVPPAAKPVAQVPVAVQKPTGPTPLQDLLPDDAHWPAQVPVDVLVLVDAPTLSPAQGAQALRAVEGAWQTLPGVEHVFARALEGELRAVIRFSSGTPPQRAQEAVRKAWLAQPPQDVGTPRLAAIGRGARARMAVSVLAPGGRQEATAQILAAGSTLLTAVPGTQRLSIAGAVRPFLTIEPLAPTLQANHQDLAHVRDALQQPMPAGGTVDAVRAALTQVKLPPQVPLPQIVSFAPGIGEPVREARNGHLPVTALVLDASPQQTDGPLVTACNGWRRDPARAQDFHGTDLHPQFIGNTYRYALWARDVPETPDAFAQRLQALRQLPEITSVFATQGTDGIPELLDRDGEGGRVWTVWVAASAPQMEVVLQAVHQRLSRTADDQPGPWLVHPLAADWDTSLGWLLGTQASGALLAVAADATRLGPTIGAVAEAVQRNPAVWQIRTGPQKQAPGPLWARHKPGAPPLPPDLLALAQRLTLGPQLLTVQAGVPIWLGLPGGERQAQQGNVPVLAQGAKQVILSDLQQLPSTEAVLQQVAVDGKPALWLAVDVRTEVPDSFALTFADVVERTVDPSGGLRVLPLLIHARTLGADVPR
jgi:multidrug efflux pump subunit AcrB